MRASEFDISLRGFWREENRLLDFKVTKLSKKRGDNEEKVIKVMEN